MASAYDKFAKAERLEMVCAEIYRMLASQFRADPAANALFLRLENEEIQHAFRVQKLRSLYSNDSKLRGNVELDVAAIDRLLKDADILKGLFSSPNSSISLAEAKQFMADLEHKFAIAHAESMAAATSPEIRRMFEILSQQDHAHASLLKG